MDSRALLGVVAFVLLVGLWLSGQSSQSPLEAVQNAFGPVAIQSGFQPQEIPNYSPPILQAGNQQRSPSTVQGSEGGNSGLPTFNADASTIVNNPVITTQQQGQNSGVQNNATTNNSGVNNTSNTTTNLPSTGFVTASGMKLMLDGQQYRFVGVNVYGLASDGEYHCGGEPDNPDGYVENLFAVLEQNHVNAVRFWAFQSFSHDNFAAIDRVVNAAKRHNVKLIPTLENHWEDCTQDGKKTAGWYSNPDAVYGSYALTYRQFIQRIVERYKYETTILMWQLMNEAESGDAAALYSFARDTSAVIKNIDQNHLVSFGTLGTDQAGTNDQHYIDLHSLPTIDVVEAHDYNRETQPLPGYPWNGDVDRINTIAADLAVARRINKPFFIGEAGIGSRSDRVELFQAKMTAAFNNGTTGYLIWRFDTRSCGGTCFNPSNPLMEIFRSYN